MKREIDTKYYTYAQNNSGGYYIMNEDVGESIIVEAPNSHMANLIAEEIIQDYTSFCECCGERWYIEADDSDGTDEPMFFNKAVLDVLNITSEEIEDYEGYYSVVYPYNDIIQYVTF